MQARPVSSTWRRKPGTPYAGGAFPRNFTCSRTALKQLSVSTLCWLWGWSLLPAVPAVATAGPTWRESAYVIPFSGPIELIDLGVVQQDPPLRKFKVGTKYFWVFPDVVTPSIHTTQLLAFTWIQRGDDVLEIGSGAGVQSIYAAENARRVVATDINPKAVENTRYNAERHGVEHVVTTRQGDLFAPIREGETFDVILFNVAYPYNDQTRHLWKIHERFFREAGHYLRPGGRIFYQAGYIKNLPRISAMIESNGFMIMEMQMRNAPVFNREPIVFLVQRKP